MKGAAIRRGDSRRWLGLAALAFFALILAWGQASAGDKERGYLGIYLEPLDNETREALKFKGDGVLVNEVAKESPADEAGVEDGDIIVKFGDKAVRDVDELREMIAASQPGDKAVMVVFRDGKEINLTAKLGEAEDVAQEFRMYKGMKGRPGRMMMMKGGCCGAEVCGVWLGVEVQKLSDQLAEYFKVKDGEGMLVATVLEGTPAQKAGLKAGDVIIKIGDEEVSDRADLREAICGKKAGDEVDVTLLRDGQKRTLKVALADMPKEHCDMKAMGGRGMSWFGPEGLELNLEGIGPEIERHMLELPEHLDGSMEELQEQLDQLREELDNLKLKMENK